MRRAQPRRGVCPERRRARRRRGALFLAAATGAGPDGTAAHELEAQADALVSAAAHFEATADRARGIAREPS
jgi:hypothetical protein